MTRFSALNRVALVATLLLVGVASSLHAQTITTFDVPNSTGTAPQGVNLRGEVTGYYYTEGLRPHGFLRYRNGTIITFDVELFGHFWQTWAWGINASGEIIGYVSVPAGGDFGFLRETDGTIVTFKGGTSTPSAAVTEPAPKRDCGDGDIALAINAVGKITGTHGGNCYDGFLRHRNGTYILFQVSSVNRAQTIPQAINRRAQITGYYVDPERDDYFHGFLRQRNGSLITFDVPNSTATEPKAINNSGQIAGHYEDADLVSHAFLRQPDGTFITFDPPGSIDTQVTAINKKGVITGFYATADGMYHGFLRTRHGVLKSFDAPNAANEGTFPKDINNRGQIVGYYEDANFVLHGFVRKPW
jgi:uncharacterized membrane protein